MTNPNKIVNRILGDRYSKDKKICKKCKSENIVDDGTGLFFCDDCGHCVNQKKAAQAWKKQDEEVMGHSWL